MMATQSTCIPIVLLALLSVAGQLSGQDCEKNRQFNTPGAYQAAAADYDFAYAITNKLVVKHVGGIVGIIRGPYSPFITSQNQNVFTSPQQRTPVKQLPDPDGKPADMSKPVQVYILMGQSNMLGIGKIAGGRRLAGARGAREEQVPLPGRRRRQLDRAQGRAQRARHGKRHGRRCGVFNNEWMTITGGKIGPEIRHRALRGARHRRAGADPQELHRQPQPRLGPAAAGQRALRGRRDGQEDWRNEDLRLRRLQGFAGKWEKGTEPKTIGWYAGMQYDGDVANAKKVLAELDKYYPGAKGYEVAGFFFWQGDKDRYNAAHASRYEQNLVHLIKQLRKDFDAPNAKFVCATLGQTEKGAAGNEGLILDAMFAVDGKSGKYPEFKGNVATVYTNPLCPWAAPPTATTAATPRPT